MQSTVENGDDSVEISFCDWIQGINVFPVEFQIFAGNRSIFEYIPLWSTGDAEPFSNHGIHDVDHESPN